MREVQLHAKAWMTAAQNLGNAIALDKRKRGEYSRIMRLDQT
jgi:hypothetical protein